MLYLDHNCIILVSLVGMRNGKRLDNMPALCSIWLVSATCYVDIMHQNSINMVTVYYFPDTVLQLIEIDGIVRRLAEWGATDISAALFSGSDVRETCVHSILLWNLCVSCCKVLKWEIKVAFRQKDTTLLMHAKIWKSFYWVRASHAFLG